MLILTMRGLALRLSSRARREGPAMPESITRLVDPCVLKAREKFREISEALGVVFREASTRVDVPSAEARQSFRDTVQEVRRQNLLVDQSLETVTSFLSLSHRLDLIANDLETCRNLALALTIERYWDDYVL
jgi:hypothetical protein